MSRIASLTAAAFLGLAPAAPAAQTQPSTDIRDFDVETVERLGRAIYEQDRFAWVGTDALLAQVPEDDLVGLIGWIVVERDGANVVRFGRGDMANPSPFFDVSFRGDQDPEVTVAEGVFSDDELSRFRAAALARAGVTQPCSDRYNIVVLPDVDGDGWLAWAFAATTEPGVIPLGGHYRLTVSQDGRTVEQADRLSRGCLMMPRASPEVQGAEEVMLTTIHLVSNTPVETYVFASLSNQIPIMVVTPDRQMWGVLGDDISRQGVLPER